MSDMDWNVTDEERAEIRADHEKFERENPNHPVTIKARKYRAEHQADAHSRMKEASR